VDDVWRKTHAETFRVGNQSRLLLTTRDAEVAAELGATVQPVPLMTREEAVCLLEEWADGNLREVDKGLKARIVERLGRLPLALRLAGAQLRSCEPNSWLATFDVYRLNAKRIEGVHDSLVATFELSLKELKETQRQLYTSLAIFKEGESIPETALHKLWSGLAEFDATQTAELLEDLASRALLTLENTATPRCANLHDLLRDFIASKLNAESRRDTHLRLLQAYRLTCRGMGWHTAPDDGYLYSHLAYHLKHAQQWDDVHTLFKDQNWMHTRVPQCNYDYDGYLSDLMIAWENAHKRTQEQIAADKMPTALAACVRYALIRTSVNSLAANYPPELVARAVAIGLWPPQRALSLAVKVLDPRQRARFFVALLTIDQLDYDTYTFVKQQALNAACAIRNEIDRGQLLTVLSWQLQGEEREQVLRERRVEVGVYEEKRTIGPLIQQLTGDELRRELTAALAIENDEEYRVNLLSLLVPQLTEKDLLEELATVRAIEDDDFFAEVTMALAPLLRNENSQEWLASTLAIQDKYYRVQALAALLPTLKNKKREEMLRVALEAARAIEKGYESRAQALATLALHLMDEERRLVVHEVLEEIWEIPDGWCRAQVLVSVAPLLTGENLRDELETMIKAKSPETHALTLAILASQLMDKDREQAVREVMDEVWVIETEKEWYRAQVLVAVAPLLTGESLHEGLNAARTIKDTRLHLRALAALVSRLTNGERNQVVREVLERVWAIENDWDRVPVFEAVAPFLVDENLHEGLKVALAIEDERARIQVLAALAPSLPRKQVYETLLEFVESSLNKERSEVLQLCARRNFFTPTSLSTEIFNAIAKHIIEICRKWQWQ
ncbi:hypothetical protein HUU40_28610, partial [candidate division KSB1 bacterium]|nr:hypothetical protein [candidate division KSB1 bacterium]